MEFTFYIAAVIAVIATLFVVINTNPVHALLYLIVSLLSVALMFYTLGAPFVAALEVLIYAGSIVVLFIFVVMMLNLGSIEIDQERRWLTPSVWIGPSILCTLLLIELIYILVASGEQQSELVTVGAREVGAALYGPYLLAVELGSMLLLAGLIGAYHLGRRDPSPERENGE